MIDLSALIVDAREQERAKKEAEFAEREAAAAQLRAEGLTQFIEKVRGELGDELLQALNPHYEARIHIKTAGVTMYWQDEDSATKWTLDSAGTHWTHWTLKATNKRGTSDLNWEIFKGNLREKLLLGIGFVRENVATARAREEAARIEREEERAAANRDRLLREQEEAEMLAAADEIHAEIEALIAERTVEEEAKLWQWKRAAGGSGGATITLYRVKYCTGMRYVEDEGSEFDYSTGWTLTDCFNEDGYITLMNGSKPRHLLLDIYTHMPIWERHTFSSPDELPRDLRERSGFVIKGITKRCFTDGHWRWVYDDSEAWGCTAAPDGVPVEWVRELVDAAQ